MIKKFEEFQKWFKSIARKANRDMKLEELRVWPSAKKNTAIKDKFRNKLKKLKPSPMYETRPYIKDKKDKGEWLYDFIWRKLDKSKNLEKIILAMEIEMATTKKKIKDDFNKLIQSDAKYKIMVFQQNSKDKNEKKAEKKVIDKVNSIFTELKAVANSYKPKSTSNYLLCAWCVPLGKFEFEDLKVKAIRKSAA